MQATEKISREEVTGTGRLTENTLRATANPALERLAEAVANRGRTESTESYSRMHNRHNRS